MSNATEQKSTCNESYESSPELIAERLEEMTLRADGDDEEYDEEDEDVIHLEVGGNTFMLTKDDVSLLQSAFLSSLVDPESSFKKPCDGIYKVDADAECFSAFLHLTRVGALLMPTTSSATLMETADEMEYYLLLQADFWGIVPGVKAALELAKANWCSQYSDVKPSARTQHVDGGATNKHLRGSARPVPHLQQTTRISALRRLGPLTATRLPPAFRRLRPRPALTRLGPLTATRLPPASRLLLPRPALTRLGPLTATRLPPASRHKMPMRPALTRLGPLTAKRLPPASRLLLSRPSLKRTLLHTMTETKP
jgi:hypothetical protein